MPYVTQCLKDAPGVLVAASDYFKVLPDSIDRWMPRRMRSLGTDGFGRSEDRAALRDFFEVDARFVAAGHALRAAQGRPARGPVVAQGDQGSGHQPDKPNPAVSSYRHYANRIQAPRTRREHQRRRRRPRARDAGRLGCE